MKRDAQLKAVFFLEQDSFQSGVSLHFLAFLVYYAFSKSCKRTLIPLFKLRTILDSMMDLQSLLGTLIARGHNFCPS